MDTSTAPGEAWDMAPEATPRLALAGFSGPLEQLLTLARAAKIDLSTLSLAALLDQLAAALRQAPAAVSLGQKGDWVVMAAWLLQLRSRLLLAADAPARQDAAAAADQLRGRLVALAEIQALACWLERRPQLGRDVFARGAPEIFGIAVEAGPAIDVVEFLWASLALFDDEPGPDTANAGRPVRLDLFAVAEARDRILRRLAETPEGGSLDRFLPDMPDVTESGTRSALRRRSAWASTFAASLELARQGAVVLEQEADFLAIQVTRA
jgi:segregation and condensation protein A